MRSRLYLLKVARLFFFFTCLPLSGKFFKHGSTCDFFFGRYRSPIFGEGWLSASGSFRGLDGWVDTGGEPPAEPWASFIKFDDFWWDVGPDLEAAPSAADPSPAEAAVRAVGRAGFLPALSVFPVAFLDADLCVFSFPPLGVRIVARRGSENF